NTAATGGALGCYNGGLPTGSVVYVENCVFSENAANGNGGVMNMYTSNCGFTAVNSVFAGNTAGTAGGCIVTGNTGTTTLRNRTFANNTASSSASSTLYIGSGGTVHVNNSIIWGPAATQVQNFGAVNYNYSDVRGISPLPNSMNLDPLFVNDADPDGADDIWG